MKEQIEKIKSWIIDIEFDLQQEWPTKQEKALFERQRRDLLFMLALAESLGENPNIAG